MGVSIICGILSIFATRMADSSDKRKTSQYILTKFFSYVFSFCIGAGMWFLVCLGFYDGITATYERTTPVVETYKLEPLYDGAYAFTVMVTPYRSIMDYPSVVIKFDGDKHKLALGTAKIRTNADVEAPIIEVYETHLKNPIHKFLFFDFGDTFYRIYLPDDNINGEFPITDYDYSTF